VTFRVYRTVIAPSNMNRFFFFFFLVGGKGGTNMPMAAIDALSHEARLNYFAYRSFCDYATINLFMFSSWPKLNVCLERKKDETK
jgi:hypothetical protein